MTLNDITVNFSHLKVQSILSDWTWLIGKSKLPIMLCSSGDAFVQDKKSLEVYFLDVWRSGENQKMGIRKIKIIIQASKLVGLVNCQ